MLPPHRNKFTKLYAIISDISINISLSIFIIYNSNTSINLLFKSMHNLICILSVSSPTPLYFDFNNNTYLEGKTIYKRIIIKDRNKIYNSINIIFKPFYPKRIINSITLFPLHYSQIRQMINAPISD